MSVEAERRALAIVERLLALPAAEREAALADACGDDDALRAEVVALLAAGAVASGFLEPPAAAPLSAAASAAASAETMPARIGPYRLLREIGRGGMGRVFLARRDGEGFEQDVAIKLVRAGMDSELVLQRFKSERQILAGLQHPNIARLFDGGTTADGAPYFVMEHVAGEDLLQWCDRRRLSTARRLELFRQVCAAVQFAHQRLVVHRDLKPGNILVGEDGVPKLLDFGLAKVLDPTSAAETAGLTALGFHFFTPEYASPEQVRGDLISIASDVYSLGVILYELLTGRRPYLLRTRTAAEIERVVCGAVPERPSTVVTRRAGEPGETAASVAAQTLSAARDSTPARLRRTLAGDLDNIVLKALRKEPERRYASVEQLAEDLRRHLAGLPVSARPDTLAYRTRKFVRRHAAAVAAVTTFLLLLAGLAAWDNARLRRERDRAERVSAFLVGLFQGADPDRTKGAHLSAQDILDRGTQRLRVELADQPESRARMELVIGDVYVQLGLYRSARPLFADALATRRRLFPERSLEVAEAERSLGAALHRLAEDRLAHGLLAQAFATQEAIGADPLVRSRTLSNLGNTVKALGDMKQARRLLERSVVAAEQAAGPPKVELAWALNDLGLVCERSHDFPAARRAYERALAIHIRLSGPASPAVAGTLDNIGELLHRMHDEVGALQAMQRAEAINERALGPNSRAVAIDWNDMANLFLDTGDDVRAEPAFRRALAGFEAALGPEHPDLCWSLRGLAMIAAKRGDLRAALPFYERALANRRKAYGGSHPQVAQSLVDVGTTRAALGEAAAALPLLREAVAYYTRTEPPDDEDRRAAEAALAKLMGAPGGH